MGYKPTSVHVRSLAYYMPWDTFEYGKSKCCIQFTKKEEKSKEIQKYQIKI